MYAWWCLSAWYAGAEACVQVHLHVEVRGQCQIFSSILHPSHCHHHCRHPPPLAPLPASETGVFTELTDWSDWLNVPVTLASLHPSTGVPS